MFPLDIVCISVFALAQFIVYLLCMYVFLHKEHLCKIIFITVILR